MTRLGLLVRIAAWSVLVATAFAARDGAAVRHRSVRPSRPSRPVLSYRATGYAIPLPVVDASTHLILMSGGSALTAAQAEDAGVRDAAFRVHIWRVRAGRFDMVDTAVVPAGPYSYAEYVVQPSMFVPGDVIVAESHALMLAAPCTAPDCPPGTFELPYVARLAPGAFDPIRYRSSFVPWIARR